MAECAHEARASLYRRAPKQDGGGFIPDAQRCRACGALLERDNR